MGSSRAESFGEGVYAKQEEALCVRGTKRTRARNREVGKVAGPQIT